MSAENSPKNPPNSNRVPSAQFINIQSLLGSKNKKSIGQGLKLYDSPKNETNSAINNNSSKATILTTCHDEFEPISDDKNIQGMTLDKVLGGTFRQIDLTNMKDFSSELFPSKPVIAYSRSKTYTKRKEQEDIGSTIMEEPKESNSFHVKETRDDEILKDSSIIAENKDGSYYFNKSLISTVKSGPKESQQSLVLDKKDSGLEDSFQKSPESKSPSSQKKFLQQLRIKKRVYDNHSNSPPPVNSSEKTGKYQKKKVPKFGTELVSINNMRSIDCSVERKKSKPLNEFIKKAEADLRDLSFGVEGKSIDCTPTKRITHKNNSLAPPDKRPSVYKLGMDEVLLGKGNQKVLEVLRKTGMAFNETQKFERYEQLDLYQKYSTKFGIKPQEYFGANSVLESKLISIKQSKAGKSPSPILGKKSYLDIDLYKAKVPHFPNKNIFKESSGRAAL